MTFKQALDVTTQHALAANLASIFLERFLFIRGNER